MDIIALQFFTGQKQQQTSFAIFAGQITPVVTSYRLQNLQKKHNVSMVEGHYKRAKYTFPGCSELLYHKNNDWSFQYLSSGKHAKRSAKFSKRKSVYGVEWKRGIEEVCLLFKGANNYHSKMIISQYLFSNMADMQKLIERRLTARKTSQNFRIVK